MEPDKLSFLTVFAEQIESQVQFGDNKASLLIAGDAILLAISGAVIKNVSGCPGDQFTVACIEPSIAVMAAFTAAALLVLAIACALWAARPAPIHDDPPRLFFLLSYLARLEPRAFVDNYHAASADDLIEQTLLSIHGKACYAATKFRRLKWAIDATLLSLAVLAVTLVLALASR